MNLWKFCLLFYSALWFHISKPACLQAKIAHPSVCLLVKNFDLKRENFIEVFFKLKILSSINIWQLKNIFNSQLSSMLKNIVFLFLFLTLVSSASIFNNFNGNGGGFNNGFNNFGNGCQVMVS